MGILDKLRAKLGTPSGLPAAGNSAAPDGVPPERKFAWQLLGSPDGTHMEFLDPDYAPIGLVDMIVDDPGLVLDVGCFCGAAGALIKQRWPGATVIGIEPLKGAADRAAERIDRVINSTLEDVAFEDIGVSPKSVDTIVFADVLEHMYNPWAALETVRPLLADDAAVFASIPNVRNLALIHKLVTGRWTYEGFGLLDVTHIRFFTLAEVRDMFAQTGYRVEAVTHNIDQELARVWELGREMETANVQIGSLVVNNVSRADRMELATRQFFIKARKDGQ